MCSESVPLAALEQHEWSCPGRAAASRTATPQAGGIKALRSDVEEWARGQLANLGRRFCVSTLDESVALAALAVCTDKAEVRDQAVMIIADNQPVKNFAAEFW
eukprot:CAMPEP_0176127980 /NCGR_PEP_ID=MMETSP0120_2-20121206/64658_1 /TAXON_ID=160619 /ORGANISM="Kryptoperidinium foliaceum, Strain CCMP 1326" /LENGTH=102 /DNA_ID=CAMNT_0017463049 /DNA_START=1 /DNA_END=306 /DNA_ORIENTATION=+